MDYVVVDREQLEADITTVADAIREKGGTSEPLVFPSGMVDAVRGIQSGGGGDYTTEQIVSLVDGSITDFVIPDGMTTIGEYAFYYKRKLKNVTFPDSVTLVGVSAFQGCGFTTITFPKNLVEIKTRGFGECSGLIVTELPNTLKIIGELAFSYQKGTTLKIPSSVTTIDKQAFSSNSNLTDVTFLGKTTSITTNTFQNCPNLTTINVPWAEGEVANAPWGATNATINYNYTEG